jgi:tetratricopeptide (TPR) repeat protein
MAFRCIIFICPLLLLSCASNSQQYHIERANQFVISGDNASAAAEFEEALKIDAPNPPSLWQLRMVTGDCYTRMKEYEKALKHYEAAEAVMKSDYENFRKLAGTEENGDRKIEYLEIIQRRILPWRALSCVAQARTYCALGKDKAFSLAAELALIYDQRNLVARLLFARSLEKTGDYDRALKEWTTFLAQARNTPPAEREASGITEKEMSEAEDRMADLLSRQAEESTP